ncbi:GDA1/CD39 nucleoside phosphatase protein [Cymbomonas tetramitiformis]|uniref:GDA1/CD39 nucleoside phosphatase protein n=1 Tax=Cymbomonas tetramitiformis TaxID=36881 RepID=A0AAE0G2T7_9CHLO|nr:GDA1/CD39 nucleoside phosphatase protein [Cymbomonas tetramitiformis]
MSLFGMLKLPRYTSKERYLFQGQWYLMIAIVVLTLGGLALLLGRRADANTFAVVIDSRAGKALIHVFGFTKDENGMLVLQEDRVEKVEPGLGFMLEAPSIFITTLKAMLRAADDRIPETNREGTPFTLRSARGVLSPVQLPDDDVACGLSPMRLHEDDAASGLLCNYR